jgi:predicted ATPase
MLTKLLLQNFKSFGSLTSVPLEPITVLVGPNNCGKTNLLSVGRFIRGLLSEQWDAVIAREGGSVNLRYRRPPAATNGETLLGWETDDGSSYNCRFVFGTNPQSGATLIPRYEELRIGGEEMWQWNGGHLDFTLKGRLELQSSETASGRVSASAFGGLGLATRSSSKAGKALVAPLSQSRELRLSIPALRADYPVAATRALGDNGSGLAAFVGTMRASYPAVAASLDETVRASLPEVKHVLAGVVSKDDGPAYRLWIEEESGEKFDASRVSDGVVGFVGLAAFVLGVPAGAIVFVEEPEQAIHPRRLLDIVEMMRKLVRTHNTQFIIATHSPVLLNAFRDEPASIVLMRRGKDGTEVKALPEVPALLEALSDADPGDMLANGFFNAPF